MMIAERSDMNIKELKAKSGELMRAGRMKGAIKLYNKAWEQERKVTEKGDIVTEKTEPQPICDYCEKPLGDKIWVVPGLIYKCCSTACLLWIQGNPRVVSWEEWKESNGSIFYP